jgi:hypothetical protein
MTYDGAATTTGDATAVGSPIVGGPAGVPDATPAPLHDRTFPRRTSGGQARGIGSVARSAVHSDGLLGRARTARGRRLWPDVR